MANGIRTGDPSGFNKGCGSKFRKGSRVRQTPEEGLMTYRSKHCKNENKDEDNSQKNLNDKNQFDLFDRIIDKENISFFQFAIKDLLSSKRAVP